MGRDGVDTRVEMAWVNKARRERDRKFWIGNTKSRNRTRRVLVKGGDKRKRRGCRDGMRC